MSPHRARTSAFAAGLALLVATVTQAGETRYDLVLRGGLVLDGSGQPPYIGDVAIAGERIAYVGARAPHRGRREIAVNGLAVAPGFINVLSQAHTSLLVDGRGLSDLVQGVTLQVLGEGTSMGPWSPSMQQRRRAQQGDLRYDVTWSTLDEYLRTLERRGVAMNVASNVGTGTLREHVVGLEPRRATARELAGMRRLLRKAMEDGAIGVSSALIYTPGSFADTDELAALATEAGRCGGAYLSHIRSEGDDALRAVDELVEISRRSGAPAEVFHLKVTGRDNWPKFPLIIERIEQARRAGQRITANAYVYSASSTGLDVSMPAWARAGGLDAWIARLQDPASRARVLAEMRSEIPTFESRLRQAGADGVLLVGFRSDALKPLIGRTLADVARERGQSPEETALDLVIEDRSRVEVVYFVMSEDIVAQTIALPWVSFGSDGAALAPEPPFVATSTHPRAYGNFARLLGRYVRDQGVITLPEAIRRLTSLPAHNLGLRERGALREGWFADVAVFDPAVIRDHATYEQPHRLATGVRTVIVNGQLALDDGEPTGVMAGQVVRGRAWRGWSDGGCRSSASDWRW